MYMYSIRTNWFKINLCLAFANTDFVSIIYPQGFVVNALHL